MTPRPRPHRALLCLLLVLLGTGSLSAVTAPDPRTRLDATNQPWSAAIVRIRTPSLQRTETGAQHYLEHCTASFIQSTGEPRLITAWHCIERQADLTRPPEVQWQGRWYPLRVRATGGSMAADWALLSVDGPLPGRPLALPLSPLTLTAGARVTAVGYSRDPGLGSEGAHLTAHPACQIIDNEAPELENVGWMTDCLAYRGASGGPVLAVDQRGATQIVAVISEGDRLTRSRLVPVHQFIGHIPSL